MTSVATRTRSRSASPVAVTRPASRRTDDGLVVLDEAKRTYAAPSREDDGWHLIQPAREEHRLVQDGKISAGDLCCTCKGGTFHGSCYRIEQALYFESQHRSWFGERIEAVPS